MTTTNDNNPTSLQRADTLLFNILYFFRYHFVSSLVRVLDFFCAALFILMDFVIAFYLFDAAMSFIGDCQLEIMEDRRLRGRKYVNDGYNRSVRCGGLSMAECIAK